MAATSSHGSSSTQNLCELPQAVRIQQVILDAQPENPG